MNNKERKRYLYNAPPFYTLALSLALISLFVMSYSTVGVTISSVEGSFSNIKPSYVSCDDIGNFWYHGYDYYGWDYVVWGRPDSNCYPIERRSGYSYQGTGSQVFETGEVFSFGSFNHRNFPVYGTPISGVDLEVTLYFTDPPIGPVTTTFSFDHEETPNSGTCQYPGITKCPDKVSLANSIPDQEFEIGGTIYNLEFIGFAECGQPYNAALPFYTEEGQENDSCIYGRLVAQEPAVQIEKLTDGQNADSPTGPVIDVGGAVNWSYIISNVGNVGLSNITVTDDNGTPGDNTDDFNVCTVSNLAVGASTTCTHTGTAQPGQYSNTAVASVVYDGNTYTDDDPSHYFGRDISLDVTGNLALEIVQKNAGTGQVALRELTSGNTTKKFPGTITATVNAPPGFQVGATYYTATQENGNREDADGLLVLEDQNPSNPDPDVYPLPFSSSYAGSGSTPSTSTMANLTDDFQSCGSGCYSAAYSLYVDLAKLGLDYENDDALTFYNNFWLYNDGT